MYNLYICRTYYNLYASIVRVLAQKETADLIIDDYNERNLQNIEQLCQLIKNSGVFKQVCLFYGGSDDNRLPDIDENDLSDINKLCDCFSRLNIPIDDFSGYDNVYIYNDWDGVFGKYLRFNKIEYTLVEASKNAFRVIYKTTPNTTRFLSNQNVAGLQEPALAVGRSRLCKRIEVSSYDGIPEYVLKKASLIDVECLAFRLNEAEKDVIRNVFATVSSFDYSKAYGKRNVLVLTRPYCGSDKWLPSEKIQERFLSDIIDEYGKDSVVFIKPHPRDRFQYDRLINGYNVYIIPRSFPVELLNMLSDIHFDLAVSVGETCVNSLIAVDNIVELDLEWFKGMRKKYCTEKEIELLNQL